jgi:hypothetical protein
MIIENEKEDDKNDYDEYEDNEHSTSFSTSNTVATVASSTSIPLSSLTLLRNEDNMPLINTIEEALKVVELRHEPTVMDWMATLIKMDPKVGNEYVRETRSLKDGGKFKIMHSIFSNRTMKKVNTIDW